jgi:hypothetical protein
MVAVLEALVVVAVPFGTGPLSFRFFPGLSWLCVLTSAPFWAGFALDGAEGMVFGRCLGLGVVVFDGVDKALGTFEDDVLEMDGLGFWDDWLSESLIDGHGRLMGGTVEMCGGFGGRSMLRLMVVWVVFG